MQCRPHKRLPYLVSHIKYDKIYKNVQIKWFDLFFLTRTTAAIQVFNIIPLSLLYNITVPALIFMAFSQHEHVHTHKHTHNGCHIQIISLFLQKPNNTKPKLSTHVFTEPSTFNRRYFSLNSDNNTKYPHLQIRHITQNTHTQNKGRS